MSVVCDLAMSEKLITGGQLVSMGLVSAHDKASATVLSLP